MAKTFMDTCQSRAVRMAWAAVKYSIATLTAMAQELDEQDAEEAKKAIRELARVSIWQDDLWRDAVTAEMEAHQ